MTGPDYLPIPYPSSNLGALPCPACHQTNLVLASPDMSLDEATKLLNGPPAISGMPVVDGDNKVLPASMLLLVAWPALTPACPITA